MPRSTIDHAFLQHSRKDPEKAVAFPVPARSVTSHQVPASPLGAFVAASLGSQPARIRLLSVFRQTPVVAFRAGHHSQFPGP